jgi:hypothetical protein
MKLFRQPRNSQTRKDLRTDLQKLGTELDTQTDDTQLFDVSTLQHRIPPHFADLGGEGTGPLWPSETSKRRPRGFVIPVGVAVMAGALATAGLLVSQKSSTPVQTNPLEVPVNPQGPEFLLPSTLPKGMCTFLSSARGPIQTASWNTAALTLRTGEQGISIFANLLTVDTTLAKPIRVGQRNGQIFSKGNSRFITWSLQEPTDPFPIKMAAVFFDLPDAEALRIASSISIAKGDEGDNFEGIKLVTSDQSYVSSPFSYLQPQSSSSVVLRPCGVWPRQTALPPGPRIEIATRTLYPGVIDLEFKKEPSELVSITRNGQKIPVERSLRDNTLVFTWREGLTKTVVSGTQVDEAEIVSFIASLEAASIDEVNQARTEPVPPWAESTAPPIRSTELEPVSDSITEQLGVAVKTAPADPGVLCLTLNGSSNLGPNGSQPIETCSDEKKFVTGQFESVFGPEAGDAPPGYAVNGVFVRDKNVSRVVAILPDGTNEDLLLVTDARVPQVRAFIRQQVRSEVFPTAIVMLGRDGKVLRMQGSGA